jgi:heme-degrading monooxygenase HmoA
MSYTIVFRSRLRPDLDAARYDALGNRMYELAVKMPGFLSAKDFTADDGERVTIVEFDTAEHLAAWREHPEHLPAQAEGRTSFYAAYSIQVCRVERSASFDAATGTWKRSP